MREEDKISIDIYNDLIRYFDELSLEVGEHSNIIGVFLHEIMIYLTNYLLLSNSTDDCQGPVDFPYLNKQYIKSPWPINFPRRSDKFPYKSHKVHYKLRLYANLHSLLSLFNSKKHLAIDLNSWYLKKYLPILLSAGFNLKIESQNQCYLPSIDFQFLFLKRTLKNLTQKFFFETLFDGDSEVFINNFLCYVEQYTSSEKPVFNDKVEHLLIGCPSTLPSRINAANYLQDGRVVTALSHSKSSIVHYIEPYFAYGELSYCSNYIECGNELPKKNHIESFRLPHARPKIFYCNEDVIKKINSERINAPTLYKINSMSKVAYIPNSMSETHRYGPFRDMDACKYEEWQRQLINTLNKNNINTTVKLHPSSLDKSLRWGESSLETSELTKVINDYDVFILDYMSSAHAIIAATNYPVIFFNIGLRNVSLESLEVYKKGARWFDIDLSKNVPEQIQGALNDVNENGFVFSNEYTEKYSLNNEVPQKTMADLIVDVIM